MKVNDWLKQATEQLQAAGIQTARLDCLVLLEDATGYDRAQLLAEPERQLTKIQIDELEKLLTRRAQHEPLAYIRVRSEFFGREFIISPAVLVPRPESEAMIEQLKLLTGLPLAPHIADVGCGSGALGITAKLELPEAVVELLDIDADALKVAKMNVDKFTLDIKVRKSDLLGNSSQENNVLLCNLPYVPDACPLNRAATHEPQIALFGGQDGLNLYRKLFQQVAKLPNQPLYILFEAFPSQHDTIRTLANNNGYQPAAEDDFIQVFQRFSLPIVN